MRNIYRYTGGGVTISGEGMADGYIFARPDGADSVMTNAESIDNDSGIGSSRQFLALQPRTITQEGYILRDKDRLTDRLQTVFSPLQNVELEAERWDGSKWWLDCTVTQTPDIGESWSKPHFQVLLTAYYPLWRKRTERTEQLKIGQNVLGILGQAPTVFQVYVASGADPFVLQDGNDASHYLSFAGGGTGTLSIRIDVNGKITAVCGGKDVIGKISGTLTSLTPGSLTLNASRGCVLTYREVRLGV